MSDGVYRMHHEGRTKPSGALHLSPDIAFRVVDGEAVEAATARAVHRIPLQLYRVILEFATPSTLAEIHSRLRSDVTIAELSDLLQPLIDGEILVSPEDRDDATLTSILNPATFGDPAILSCIGSAVASGRAVVIPNAVRETIAVACYDALERVMAWSPYEVATPFFQYRRHSIHSDVELPVELRRLKRVFESHSTKKRVGELTGCACGGRLSFTASRYLPGDYAVPHTDADDGRSLAYIWYLSKDWRPEWGGNLVWCPTGATVAPTFNTLVLFKVTRESLHTVTPVSSFAHGQRFSVNGWWHSQAQQDEAANESDTWPVPLVPGRYGHGTSKLLGHSDVTLL
jgi:hypothetical protein